MMDATRKHTLLAKRIFKQAQLHGTGDAPLTAREQALLDEIITLEAQLTELTKEQMYEVQAAACFR